MPLKTTDAVFTTVVNGVFSVTLWPVVKKLFAHLTGLQW